MLPIRSVLADGHYPAEDLQLPDVSDVGTVGPQPRIPYQGIPVDQTDEVLRSAGGLVVHDPELNGVRIVEIGTGMADLPAPDAPAPPAGTLHFRLDELAHIALQDARGDLRSGDVPLDALYAHVFGDLRLHLRQQLHRRIHVVGLVLAPLPHVVELGALDHQCGVELQHVRTEARVGEHRPEGFQILLGR